MALFLRALPYNDVLVIPSGKDAGKATDELVKWAESVTRQSEASPVAPEPAVQLLALDGSVSGTFGGSLVAGIYRVNIYFEVFAADPVSQSLQLTLTWTHNGKALTRVLPAFSGAPMAITDTGSAVTIVEIDPNTTIGYTLTYASNTPGVGVFQAAMIAELLQTVS